MNRPRRFLTLLLVFSVVFSTCSCSKTKRSAKSSSIGITEVDGYKHEHSDDIIINSPVPTGTATPSPTPAPGSGLNDSDDIIDFSMFIGLAGTEISDNNEIREIIAENTGVRVTESYLSGITSDEATEMLIASGKLPDYIYSSDLEELYQNGCLIPWDDYLAQYPELRALYSDEEWERFRADDGHIYWANIYDRYKNKNTNPDHIEQAFWIQTRVLEWAGYPKIETLDEYFDLLETYSAANPEMPDGSEVIPYTALCESWRYFCIESAPMYLDGYPNDGCVIVNTDEGKDKPKVVDYNTTDTARAYFEKLNEEYKKGIIDPDFAVQTYDEYISKLATGRVLGMCDQYWNFGYTLKDSYSILHSAEDGSTYTLGELGCEYVPLGLVMESGTEQRWHSYGNIIDYASGVAVTTSCIDPEKAFAFLNDLLSQEIMELRFWGIEGKDYFIDEDGLFYREDYMRENWKDQRFKIDHVCEYPYLPQWRGASDDGINTIKPCDQPSEYKAGLSESVVTCLDAYGVNSFADMVGSVYQENYPWFPLYTWSNNISYDTDYGLAWQRIGECKHEWIPKLVLSRDFDKVWEEYMAAYNECNPQLFLDAAQEEVEARLRGY